MKRLCAKDYAKSRGLPLATVRKLCRANILANFTIGRVYHIDVESADKYFEQLNKEPIVTQLVQRRKSHKSNMNFLEKLKAFEATYVK